MTNDLATILDDAGGRALIEKYLVKKFLERRDYDTVLANSTYAQTFRIGMGEGQYVEATRKNRFRIPEKVPNDSRTSDPASGASMGVVKVKLPMEYIHEYTPIGTVAGWTSWIDLDAWADEDMTMALMRRQHQLTQAMFRVGRYQPGVYDANGAASTAFDTTPEYSAVMIDGLSFTWAKAPAYFVGDRKAFNLIDEGDRHTMADYKRVVARLALAGARKINGKYVAVISESVKQDLMEDDRYFQTAVQSWNGKGVAENQLADYAGLHWVPDDEAFTEDFQNENVRASNGPIHTSFVFGQGSFAYVRLGAKGIGKPKFKVQDITKCGGEKTVGYTVPFQAGITDASACACVVGPVSESKPNNG